MSLSLAVTLFALTATAQGAIGGMHRGRVAAPSGVAPLAAPSPAPAQAPIEALKVKSSMTGKVVLMLEDLKQQILEEGEKEAKSYDEFACFCKDTTQVKSASIQKGQDDMETFSASIAERSTERNELDEKIRQEEAMIESLEKAMTNAKEERTSERKVYEKNDADLAGAIAALAAATKQLKTSKAPPSLAQVRTVLSTVRAAVLVETPRSIDDGAAQRLVAFLQQAPEVEMDNYKFHSDRIIETLEKLTVDFTAEKTSVDEEEVHAVAAHKQFMQESLHKQGLAKKRMAEASADKAAKQEEIASLSQELTVTTATLMDDQDYLKKLSAMCATKAKTWDQRSSARANELAALTSALEILKASVTGRTSLGLSQKAMGVQLAESIAGDEQAMEALEADAESTTDHGGMSFLQRLRSVAVRSPSSKDDGRQAVSALLLAQGGKLHSAVLTSLANKIAADPFAKVKFLIQELIERLLQEANNEGNQNAWCNKATSEAEAKRDASSQAVTELNGKMARLEALSDKLGNQLATLNQEVAELNATRAKATAMREADTMQNNLTIVEAREGLEAVNTAADIISKYYKTAKKQRVRASSFVLLNPMDEAPSAGFENGEAYHGAQGESGGILGMLDVIASDFERAISEAQETEASQAKEHMELMTQTGISLAEKDVATKQLSSEKNSADAELSTASDQLQTHTGLLAGVIKELLELKPVCVDTGMSYEERVALRKEEVGALNKALCVLIHYGKYGPDGASEGC